jgi:hypothetical protein
MSPALDRLRTEAALLDVNERARLAQELIESLDSEPATDDVEAQWIAEAQRRVELMDRGEMATMSAQDVHAGKPIPGES